MGHRRHLESLDQRAEELVWGRVFAIVQLCQMALGACLRSPVARLELVGQCGAS